MATFTGTIKINKCIITGTSCFCDDVLSTFSDNIFITNSHLEYTQDAHFVYMNLDVFKLFKVTYGGNEITSINCSGELVLNDSAPLGMEGYGIDYGGNIITYEEGSFITLKDDLTCENLSIIENFDSQEHKINSKGMLINPIIEGASIQMNSDISVLFFQLDDSLDIINESSELLSNLIIEEKK